MTFLHSERETGLADGPPMEAPTKLTTERETTRETVTSEPTGEPDDGGEAGEPEEDSQ